jgi:hypothetical protein
MFGAFGGRSCTESEQEFLEEYSMVGNSAMENSGFTVEISVIVNQNDGFKELTVDCNY